jgi:hypothetical protein
VIVCRTFSSSGKFVHLFASNMEISPDAHGLSKIIDNAPKAIVMLI